MAFRSNFLCEYGGTTQAAWGKAQDRPWANYSTKALLFITKKSKTWSIIDMIARGHALVAIVTVALNC